MQYAVVIAWAMLVIATAHAAGAAQITYGQWLLSGGGLDWQTVLAYTATALFGGVIRSIVTLMSASPTYQVAMELVKDVVLSATLGLPTAMVLLYVRAQMPDLVPGMEAQMLLLVAMGYMGGTVWKRLDSTLKAGISLATEGALAALARRLGLPPPIPIVPDAAVVEALTLPPPAPTAPATDGATP